MRGWKHHGLQPDCSKKISPLYHIRLCFRHEGKPLYRNRRMGRSCQETETHGREGPLQGAVRGRRRRRGRGRRGWREGSSADGHRNSQATIPYVLGVPMLISWWSLWTSMFFSLLLIFHFWSSWCLRYVEFEYNFHVPLAQGWKWSETVMTNLIF